MHSKLTKKNKRRSSSGFTLTEVIVASTLLVLGIIPVLRALTGSYIASKRIDYRTNSLFYAQSKLDEIRARSIYSYNSSYAQSDTQIENSYLYAVTDTTVNSDLRDVTVTVGFDVDRDSVLDQDEKLISLRTMIARRL